MFDDLVRIHAADANKWGQGTTDVVIRDVFDIDTERDLANAGMPYMLVDLDSDDRHPLGTMRHVLVEGTLTIVGRRDRSGELKEIAQGVRTALHRTSIAGVADTDWLPDRLIITGRSRQRVTAQDVRLSFPVMVYCSLVGASEGPQLAGAAATLTYTAGSGGVSVLMGVVEGFEHSTAHPRVGVTPDTAPNTPQFVLGPGVGSITFRAKVTTATSASSGTPNPRVPDGIAATLVIYKAGTSGQSWSMGVLVESMQHGGSFAGGQAVTYRLVRTGAVTETLQ